MIHRRNRKVLLHLIDRETTVEGLLVREGWKRDYVLWAPKVLAGEGETVSVSGHIEVPREQVLFKQIIG